MLLVLLSCTGRACQTLDTSFVHIALIVERHPACLCFPKTGRDMLTFPDVDEPLEHPSHRRIAAHEVGIERPKEPIRRAGDYFVSLLLPETQRLLARAEHGR